MGIISYIGSIVSSVNRKKDQESNKQRSNTPHPIHACTKEQHLKWISEGKCQCCGGDEGKYEGICDECGLS
jgi:hypothetical protein